MTPDSIYQDKIEFIKENEGIVMGLQSTKVEKVVARMVAVAEASAPKLRYAVPWWQGLYIQMLRGLGQ